LIRRFIFQTALVCAACLLADPSASAATAVGNATLTFEGIGDGNFVGNFYPGVFIEGVALVAGFSLDDADFPPASGVTVATPDDSPMTMFLDLPVNDFSALFTHSSGVIATFFLQGNMVGSVSTTFFDNRARSGDAGTTPNERLTFHNAGGFDEVFLSGDEYRIDDVSFAAATGVPEPGTGTLLAIAGALILLSRARRRNFRLIVTPVVTPSSAPAVQ
jgi:hypothetical protein